MACAVVSISAALRTPSGSLAAAVGTPRVVAAAAAAGAGFESEEEEEEERVLSARHPFAVVSSASGGADGGNGVSGGSTHPPHATARGAALTTAKQLAAVLLPRSTAAACTARAAAKAVASAARRRVACGFDGDAVSRRGTSPDAARVALQELDAAIEQSMSQASTPVLPVLTAGQQQHSTAITASAGARSGSMASMVSALSVGASPAAGAGCGASVSPSPSPSPARSPVTVSAARGLRRPQLQTVLTYDAHSLVFAGGSSGAAGVSDATAVACAGGFGSIIGTLMTLNRPGLCLNAGAPMASAPAVASVPQRKSPSPRGTKPAGVRGVRAADAKPVTVATGAAAVVPQQRARVAPTRIGVEQTIAPFKFAVRRGSAAAVGDAEGLNASARAAADSAAAQMAALTCVTAAATPLPSSRTILGMLMSANAAGACPAAARTAAAPSPAPGTSTPASAPVPSQQPMLWA